MPPSTPQFSRDLLQRLAERLTEVLRVLREATIPSEPLKTDADYTVSDILGDLRTLYSLETPLEHLENLKFDLDRVLMDVTIGVSKRLVSLNEMLQQHLRPEERDVV